MLVLEAIYCDYSDCSDEFKNGIEYLQERSFALAADCFQAAFKSVSKLHKHHNIYISYFGIAKLMQGDSAAIDLCRIAICNESKNADVFLNLARAENFCENRLNAVLAIEKGLGLDRCHPGLCYLHKKIGVRERNTIPFLPRQNPVNQFMGKRLRKNKAY